MDQSTHNVRIACWKSIIQSCQERPAGITAKQWLAENNISDKSYYYYLRKFRKEAYLSLDQESSLTPLVSNQNQVSFAEVPFDMPEQQKNEILDTLVNFLTVIIYNILRVYLGKKYTYIVVGVISTIYLIFGNNIPAMIWGLDRVFRFIGFYAIGNILNDIKFDKKLIPEAKNLLISVGLLILVFGTTLLPIEARFYWYITGTIGTIALMIISYSFEKIGFINPLSHLGKCSLVILCIHGPIYRVIIKVISVVFKTNTDNARSNIILVIITTCCTLMISCCVQFICRKFFPWMIGKN